MALALVVSLAAPVTAQALTDPPRLNPATANYFAAAKKDTSKKKTTKKKTTKKKTNGISVNGDQSSIGSGNLPTSSANTNTIKTLLQIAFGIIGAFALLSMTASGFKYITSGGDPGKTSEAKKGIVFALVGLMIAISAEAIVAFVIRRGAP